MKRTTITILSLGVLLLFAGTAAVSNEAPDGERLYQRRCSQCHDLGRVERATKDRAGWETTVDRMMDKRPGLLNAQERQAVVEYLVNR